MSILKDKSDKVAQWIYNADSNSGRNRLYRFIHEEIWNYSEKLKNGVIGKLVRLGVSNHIALEIEKFIEEERNHFTA